MTNEEIKQLVKEYDPVPIHNKTPEQLNFCGWIELSWGWKCWINADIATYDNRIAQDGFGDPPIRFRKQMLSVKEFKEKKLKFLKEKKLAKQKSILEKANKL